MPKENTFSLISGTPTSFKFFLIVLLKAVTPQPFAPSKKNQTHPYLGQSKIVSADGHEGSKTRHFRAFFLHLAKSAKRTCKAVPRLAKHILQLGKCVKL
jgi:hypothetical protein